MVPLTKQKDSTNVKKLAHKQGITK